jgi:hypothetical protein
MYLLIKIKRFLSLDVYTKMLLFEAYYYLGWGRFVKILPFNKIVSMLGKPMLESSNIHNPSDREMLLDVSKSLHIMSQYTFWESQCLVKAIAAIHMLKRRRIECTLYLGTSKDEKGSLIAHAWVRSGKMYICGAEDMNKFTVVGVFGSLLYKGEKYEK